MIMCNRNYAEDILGKAETKACKLTAESYSRERLAYC